MRRTTLLVLSVVMASWLIPELADAAPRRYRPTRPRVQAGQPAPPAVRPAPVRRYAPAPRVYRSYRPHVRYVYRGGVWVAAPYAAYPVHHTTVVTTPAPAPVVVKKQPQRFKRVGLLLKLGVLNQTADSMQQYQDYSMAALGVAMRYNFDPHWAMELGVETAYGSDNEPGWTRERQTTPLTASLVLNMLPKSALNIYGLAGAGLQFTQVRTDSYAYYLNETYTRPAFHLGGGLELKLNSSLRLFTDVKFLMLGSESGREISGEGAFPASSDEGDTAVQVNAGLGVYF